jgi:hypothetical protein
MNRNNQAACDAQAPRARPRAAGHSDPFRLVDCRLAGQKLVRGRPAAQQVAILDTLVG